MEDARISELLRAAAKEPPAPKRLVERTCWKARVAEARFSREAGAKKHVARQKNPEMEKGTKGKSPGLK